jgi:Flp pilus assembly protein TadD/ketosteroid isomerase-like protein
MFYSTRSGFARQACAVFGLVAALASASALADDNADISRLMRAGQYGEAMQRVDGALAQRPRDAQLRFLKGLIFTEQNRTNDAIAVFTKLSEDYPELPEPYNNLAVLYAGSGQYDKARTALEMAIRTNPTYATAHENLGDVYARLASQAYDKALQLDSRNTTAKSKLTLVRTLVTTPGTAVAAARPAAPVATPSRPAVAAPAPAVSAPPVLVAKAEPKTETKAEPKPEPKQDSKAEKAKAAKAEALAKAEARDNERDDVLKAVHGWARAWAAKDMRGYLAAYGNDFQPPNGASRKVWTDERRARIEGKGSIQVKIEQPQVSVNGSTATVSFRQIYSSDTVKANSRKTLVLTKQGGRWQIKQERAAG